MPMCNAFKSHYIAKVFTYYRTYVDNYFIPSDILIRLKGLVLSFRL